MSVRERCSCGAEFECERDDELRLLREWRRVHVHEFEPGGVVVSDSGRSDAAPDSVVPELHIGFRGDPFE